MMLFNYDPILGLTYCLLSPDIYLDISDIPSSLDMSPKDVIALFHSKGLLFVDSLKSSVDKVFSLFHNGIICNEEPVKYINPFLFDEVGQFNKEYWQI
jgi:hypothetical protein